jgi:serine/threonine protein kinase
MGTSSATPEEGQPEYGWYVIYHDSKSVPLSVVAFPGHGSLGVVVEVQVLPSTKRSFVRKRVRILFGEWTRLLKIIQQEVDALRRLSHPHIVNIIGTYQDGPKQSQRRHFYSILIPPVGEANMKEFLDDTSELPTRDAGTSPPNDDRGFKRTTKESWMLKWFECLASALA